VPLAEGLASRPGTLSVTCSPGQRDVFLKVAYDLGAVLLELDGGGRPVRAYRRPDRETN
jgi:hypothetical protein